MLSGEWQKMVFSLTKEDFEACKESKSTNYVAPVREKFDEELKPQLIEALGDRFKNFIVKGKHPSPYIARAWSLYKKGMYRGNMWLGMASRKYEDPRYGIQLQFGINHDEVFSFGIWFEDTAVSAKRDAAEAARKEKADFAKLLRSLGDTYEIHADGMDNKELNIDADKITEEHVDQWIEFLSSNSSSLKITRKLSVQDAIAAGTNIVTQIAQVFGELLPLYNLLAGEQVPVEKTSKAVVDRIGETRNDLDRAVQQFRADPRSSLWKAQRETIYPKFAEMFKPVNLNKLTKDDFTSFLNVNNNKSWTGLQRNESAVTADMNKLRKVCEHLQNEQISIEERLDTVFDKEKSEFAIDGMGPGLVSAILLVCDKKDQYGVWNSRSQETLRRFGLIPEKLPTKMSEAYILINKALIGLKKKYNLTLVEVDIFVYWADAFYGKAILWSADPDKYPDVIKNHQDHIKIAGATLWGAGFPVRMDEFNLPFELPLPLHGYLYEKGKKVTFHATIEGIESYRKPTPPKDISLRPKQYTDLSKTYLKLSMLEPLPEPKEVGDFIKWGSNEPVSQPPQGYVQIIEPTGTFEKRGHKPINLDQIITNLEIEVPEYKETIGLTLAHLFAGKNIVFYGAPATSKTYLAKKICEGVCGKDGVQFQTANAEWSYFDIVGGWIPKENGTEFQSGLLLEACRNCFTSIEELGRPSWLIIDELNRANLDLAFGKIFTQLDIDYRDKPIITPNENEKIEESCLIPLCFRILATMNTYDRSLLFSLGYAFMRRFAFISVRSLFKEKTAPPLETTSKPIQDEIKELLAKPAIAKLKNDTKKVVLDHFRKISEKHPEDKAFVFNDFMIENQEKIDAILKSVSMGDFDPLDALLYISYKITNEGLVEIGHAITFDACKFIVAYSLLVKKVENPKFVLDEAVESYILPQLEYFMPKLRKGMIFSEKRYTDSWNKIKSILKELNLTNSLAKVVAAEEEFRVIG